LVEDNPGDVRFAQETLRDYRVQNTLAVVRDGDEALKYLRREPPYQSVPRPDMILLDINLPKVDGTEVLEEMKADADLAGIPVVVLVTSETDEALIKRYGLPAQCFITKPLSVEKYLEAVRCFSHFGVSIVTVVRA
jgi:CheY-like chemotaxis protein